MRTVILTGVSGGLGRDLVPLLLRADEDLAIVGVHNNGKPPEDGMRFQSERVDLTSWPEVEDFESGLPTPWAIINLAGVSHSAISWKDSAADIANVIEANLLTTVNVCRAFVPRMRNVGGGRIVNVSSVVAHVGAFGASAYGAAKAAVEGYTRSLAVEVAGKGITANTVALGYFDRGMIEHVPPQELERVIMHTPLKRLGTVGELAGLLGYLLSESSGFMTGQTLNLNGGLHV